MLKNPSNQVSKLNSDSPDEYISVEVAKKTDETSHKIVFSWSFESITESAICLKMDFKKPELVSNPNPDILQVKFRES